MIACEKVNRNSYCYENSVQEKIAVTHGAVIPGMSLSPAILAENIHILHAYFKAFNLLADPAWTRTILQTIIYQICYLME